MSEQEIHYPESRTECPECGCDEVQGNREDGHNGGGEFNGYYWLAWCGKCQHEWTEDYEPDDGH